VRQKILFVVNAEWYFRSHRLPLARALRDRGMAVSVAAREERGEGDAIRREGFEFVPLILRRRSVNPFRELASFFELLRLYGRLRPDLVHHVTVKAVLYGSIAARWAGVPAVVNAIPGLGSLFGNSGWKGSLLRRAVEAGYRFALAGDGMRLIFQNPDDRRYFLERGLTDEAHSVVIAGSGVDVDAFVPRPEPTGLPTVLLASRLLWNKGVGDLAEAALRLREGGVPCRVVLVGEPDPENRSSVPLESLRRWQDQGCLEWWGRRDDMPEVMANAAVVVLPSYYPEGVPKALLEGAAAGRPLVATDTPGCREIARPGVNAILVRPRDPEALAQAIETLVRDPGLRRNMGARSRQIAMEEFSEGRVVAETLSLYEALLHRHASSLDVVSI
jgi:glycosyltransferase involved in cell wall biosynthesis